MRLLLDTHVAIWSVIAPDRIPPAVLELITDTDNDVWVSVVVLWEIAIKAPQRRAERMPITASNAREDFVNADFAILPVQAAHALAVSDLPLLHGDPFDRLMVAQASVENLRFVTHDKNAARYDPDTITW